jgi:hypothetical protein
MIWILLHLNDFPYTAVLTNPFLSDAAHTTGSSYKYEFTSLLQFVQSYAVKAFPGLPIMLIMPSMIKVLEAERRTYSSWFFLQQPVPVPQIHPLSLDSSYKICGHLM